MFSRITNKCASLAKRIKHLTRGRLLLLLSGVAGICLLLLGSCEGLSDAQSTINNGSSLTVLTYAEAMAEEAEALCARVGGVGDVEVVIVLEEGERYTYSGSHITSSTFPAVRGVAVVCEGGERDSVRAELTRLLCALYDIGANRVHVSPMK